MTVSWVGARAWMIGDHEPSRRFIQRPALADQRLPLFRNLRANRRASAVRERAGSKWPCRMAVAEISIRHRMGLSPHHVMKRWTWMSNDKFERTRARASSQHSLALVVYKSMLLFQVKCKQLTLIVFFPSLPFYPPPFSFNESDFKFR